MKRQKQARPVLERFGKRMRRGAFAAVLLVITILLVIGLNVLMTNAEKEHAWQRDLSFNSVTTYGETTEQVLRDLSRPVHAYVLYRDDQQLLSLLDRYAAASPYFSWESVDIALNPGFLTRYRTALSETSVGTDSIVFDCEETGRFRVVSYDRFVNYSFDDDGNLVFDAINYESAITYAIQYVTRETSPRAVFLSGHGEMNEQETAALADLLTRHFYDVVYTPLNAEQLTLGDKDVVMILSPLRDLSQNELEQLTSFAEAGGSFFFAIDWDTPVGSMPNLLSLMELYGIIPRPGLVVADADARSAYYEGYPHYLYPILEQTEASLVMLQSGSPALLLPAATAFMTPVHADPYLYTDILLASPEDTYLIPISRENIDRHDDDPSGPFALGILASRLTQQTFFSRACAIGCSTALTDTEVFARTDNRELIVRITDWLLNESEFTGISARDAVRPQLSVRSVGLGSAVVLLLPIAVIAAAVVVLGFRQRH
ncbi:MAG: Gldg family protein [Clostridia bacterium]|nr:Gldg family protein [Clostridia bacterium]MBR4459798.1 Gldg family protein [Clostridia bacterium]